MVQMLGKFIAANSLLLSIKMARDVIDALICTNFTREEPRVRIAVWDGVVTERKVFEASLASSYKNN